MKLSKANEEILLKYRGKDQDTKEERKTKSAQYWERLKQSQTDGAKTTLQAFAILEHPGEYAQRMAGIVNPTTKEGDLRYIQQMARVLKQRRFIILYDNLTEDKGCLYEPGEWNERGERIDGVIVIDRKFMTSPIGLIGILGHEVRHILDHEEERAKRLNIDIINRPNSAEAQSRADTYSGIILNLLGARKDMEDVETNLSEEQKERLRKYWGLGWAEAFPDLIPKLLKAEEFDKNKAKLPRFRCGRLCNDPKRYGYCDRKMHFPPCCDH